jgi:hypothetical protein
MKPLFKFIMNISQNMTDFGGLSSACYLRVPFRLLTFELLGSVLNGFVRLKCPLYVAILA